MLRGYEPLTQTMLATALTWGVTAAGAALCVLIDSKKRVVLDASLGFAAGVMTAAAYWSLLSPAIAAAHQSGLYGHFAFAPVTLGFCLGCSFVGLIDCFLSDQLPAVVLAAAKDVYHRQYVTYEKAQSTNLTSQNKGGANMDAVYYAEGSGSNDDANVASAPVNHVRFSNEELPIAGRSTFGNVAAAAAAAANTIASETETRAQWKRILMLIIAITMHNVPEGMAVGVAFAANHVSSTDTFSNARYGQLSGMVEPIAGLIGAILVGLVVSALPYALSFAAGAMIFVVIDDIVPEAHSRGNGKFATWGCVVGFSVMMALEVGLG